MATHSSILAWRILWTDKPGRPQSTGSHRVGLKWSSLAHMIVTVKTRRSKKKLGVICANSGTVMVLNDSPKKTELLFNRQLRQKSDFLPSWWFLHCCAPSPLQHDIHFSRNLYEYVQLVISLCQIKTRVNPQIDNLKNYLFIWLLQVLVAVLRIFIMACEIFTYSRQTLNCGM